MALHPRARQVVDAAAKHGLAIEVREFPAGTRTAQEAADAIGVQVGQIVKSLVFVAGKTPILVLTSGSNRVDEGHLGTVLGGPIERARAETVRSSTGFAIGGTPPFGHATPLPVWIDRDLLAYDVVWAAAGTHTHVFAVTPGDLVRVTGGRVIAVSSPADR